MSSDNVLTCLLWMLLIGPLQVIIGFIWFATTESPKIRKHFLIYLTGVLAYFVGLGIIHRPFHDLYRFPDYQLYYFGGAGLLAAYHLVICIFGRRLP